MPERVFQIHVRPDENGSFWIEADSGSVKCDVTARGPRFLKKHLSQIQQALKVGADTRGIGKNSSGNADALVIEDFGKQLFRFLFQPEIHGLFMEACKCSEQAQEPLRLSLRIEARELARLPWETLYDPLSKRYVALRATTRLARGISPPVHVEPRTPPLRILVVIATPEELEGRPLPKIDGNKEWETIRDSLSELDGHGKVVLGRTPSGNPRDLMKKVAGERWDVIHFIGHGDVDVDGRGFLVFQANGTGSKVYAQDLLDLLEGSNGPPRLAILNACNSASSIGSDFYSNTARILAKDIPSVIGMQFQISDRAAHQFSSSLYSWLADGCTVQHAVRQTRLELKLSGPEWITPVLYMSSADGVLVRPEPGAAA